MSPQTSGQRVAKFEARREACKRLAREFPERWRVIYGEELKLRGIGFVPPKKRDRREDS